MIRTDGRPTIAWAPLIPLDGPDPDPPSCPFRVGRLLRIKQEAWDALSPGTQAEVMARNPAVVIA